MDINKSSISRYKASRPEVSRSSSEVKAQSESSGVKSSSAGSVQNQKLPDFKEGQVVKGQIIDHRYQEVRVQLEPGKQIVTARLSGDVYLSIGQEASFQVTEGAPDHLVLKYLPEDASAPEEAALQKILTASSLSATDTNKAIVSELLINRMPVDSQTLQTLIRLSHMNREASPLTLVLMYKNNIPVTKENLRQFEACQNGTNRLLGDITELTKDITGLLKEPDSLLNNNVESLDQLQDSFTSPAGRQTISETQIGAAAAPTAVPAGMQSDTLINAKNNLSQLLQSNSELIDVLLHNSIGEGEVQGKTLADYYDSKELSTLSKAVEQKIENGSVLTADTASDLMQQITSGTLGTGEAVRLLSGLVSQGEDPTSFIIAKVLNQLSTDPDNNSQLSEILSPAEQSSLFAMTDSFSDASEIQHLIVDGTATVKDLLTFLQNNLKTADHETAAKLLQSPEYHKLLSGAFLKKWTLSPEEVAKKAPVQELYQNLKDDAQSLSSLIQSGKDTSETLQIREPLKNLQDNLKFIKDLNEVYTYLPLPVQLKNQKLHSDLYVFTNKKALRENSDNVSVLLHLDMENLGPMNIHIQMSHNLVQANFSTENQEAGQLISKNIPLLEDALSKKGYHLHAQMAASYKKPNFSKDFIAQDSPDNAIKLCSFDIRT